MEERWCNACGCKFKPRAQSPRQTYCALAECQQTRKQLWQQAKRRSDPDYSANQSQAQADWAKKHPDYWRTYRAANPDYTQGNRANQQIRNATRRIAKSDASLDAVLRQDGIYRLQPIGAAGGPDTVILVRLTILGKADL